VRIGVYNESTGGSLGGSEYLVAVLAHSLSDAHAVDIVHHHPELTRPNLESFSGVDCSRIDLRFVPKTPFERARTSGFLAMWKESRSWRADVSAPYDLFVNVGHWMPPFSHARRSVLLVLFPLFNKSRAWPWNDPPRAPSDVRRVLRNTYHDWEWRRRIASYTAVATISEFARRWLRSYWDVEASVVYPPVAALGCDGVKKENVILSVGRFTSGGHPKRHAELIRAVGELCELREHGWSHECIGTLGDGEPEQTYFRSVQEVARTYGARVRTNVDRAELARRYRAATLFVHAAGYGQPDDKPELTEHFGISTVEAMSAGCVPVVINRGAQPEIVEHGVSGFLWNTLGELQSYVRVVTTDEQLRRRLSDAARTRALAFGHRRFVDAMGGLLGIRLQGSSAGDGETRVEPRMRQA